MRKMLLFFLAMMALALPVRAETVPEQVRAPERVQTELVSPTGKTVMTVDAPVIVPETEAMYIIPVSTRVFEDDMVPVLAELFWPGLEEKMKVENNRVFDGKRQVATSHWASITHWGTAQEDIHVAVQTGYYQYAGFDEPQDGALNAYVRFGNDHRLSKAVNYNISYMEREVSGECIEGHPLTGAQAAAIAEAFLRELTDEPFEVFAVGQAAGIIYDDDLMLKGLERQGTGSSYVVYLTRLVDSVPLLPAIYAMERDNRTDLLAPPVGYEEIGVALDPEGRVTAFHWRSPYQFSAERTSQTLLPFEDILSIARQMLPLKYLWMEPYTDQLVIDVTRIELGYMALMQRDTRTFALTPVWAFYGEGETLVYQNVLTVSAVDGSVIDLELGY
ncbi:MAG: hypothetical protein J1E43_04010 [Christensenellaceae bacterium]|nr:hypothetical protein [Christensenellaceae bacterium]